MATGRDMSASLNTTFVTFDALMKRFGVGEPVSPAVSDSPKAKGGAVPYSGLRDDRGPARKDGQAADGVVGGGKPDGVTGKRGAAGGSNRAGRAAGQSGRQGGGGLRIWARPSFRRNRAAGVRPLSFFVRTDFVCAAVAFFLGARLILVAGGRWAGPLLAEITL